MGRAPSSGSEMAAGGERGWIRPGIVDPVLRLASRNNGLQTTGQTDYITVLCARINPDLR